MNQKIKKILDELEKFYSNHVENRVKEDQKKYNFDMPNDSTHNNEADAYKHTWMQTELALKGNQWLAKILGDMHEKDGNIKNSQPKSEEIMDQHNNAEGRKIAKEMTDKYGFSFKNPLLWELNNDLISKEVWERMKDGKIILDPSGRTTLHEKPVAWDKHGNITWLENKNNSIDKNNTPLFKLRAEKNVYLPRVNEGEGVNDAVNNQGTKILGHYGNGNIDTGSSSDEFKTNTFDVLKKDSPYIDKTNTIDNFDVNKNSILPTKTNNSFTDLIKKSSALNNNVSIDNQDLIAKNSTLGGLDNNFINKVKGKRFQDLSDEERLKAIWHFVG